MNKKLKHPTNKAERLKVKEKHEAKKGKSANGRRRLKNQIEEEESNHELKNHGVYDSEANP